MGGIPRNFSTTNSEYFFAFLSGIHPLFFFFGVGNVKSFFLDGRQVRVDRCMNVRSVWRSGLVFDCNRDGCGFKSHKELN